MEGLEMISFQIISCVGSAKSMYMEAAMAAQNYEFDKAEQLIKEGEEIFVKGHEAHASLIQKEASGESVTPNMLLMHAEDQLMSAEAFRILADEFITLYKRIDEK
mgnify:CR=1 FL=1